MSDDEAIKVLLHYPNTISDFFYNVSSEHSLRT